MSGHNPGVGRLAITLAFLFFFGSQSLANDAPRTANIQAIEEVRTGKRATANAAWWGFDPDDATKALQQAINSGARKVIVPNMGTDWIVRPIRLAGNQELVLEEGVVITAMRGEFRGGGDMLFTAADISHLKIRGKGATLRMQKEDYMVGPVLKKLGWHRWYGQYEKAEWRMTMGIRGCTDVEILGLTLEDSGGDGIYIDGGRQLDHSRDIRIKDVVCDNHYRQGISIISVDGLLVEDSTFNNTWGTPPSSGVDIEPDSPTQKVKNVVFRNCRFEDNYGDGIEIFLSHQTAESDDISILFDKCHISSRRGSGIRVSKVVDDGPGGLIEFRDCSVENTQAYGIKVQDKSARAARVRFVRCKLKNVARNQQYNGFSIPIWLHPYRPNRVEKFGGLDFIDCQIEDARDRPAIAVPENHRELPLQDITGTIAVKNPDRAEHELGSNLQDVTLALSAIADRRPTDELSAAEGFKHVFVYHEPGRFGGWPANHGMWAWGKELLVGFGRGYHKDLGNSHNIDREKTEDHLLARSLDGGETWSIEDPSERGHLIPAGDALFGTTRAGLEIPQANDCPGGIDFTHPNFALTLRMFGPEAGRSQFHYSYDRGKSWLGPYRFPDIAPPGIDARTNYLVGGRHECTVFLSTRGSPLPTQTGNRPFCARTTDGGKTWTFISWIGPPLDGNAIMPSAARLSQTDLLCVVRRRVRPDGWLAAFRSQDNGKTWTTLPKPADDLGVGNPASLIRLQGGRMCLTYGVRAEPYRMCAKLSSDGGQTWSQEIVLRDDGGNHDLGYPRSVQRPDGKVVTVYYFWDKPTGPERYIAATIWNPGAFD